jgi:hypothetical protein
MWWLGSDGRLIQAGFPAWTNNEGVQRIIDCSQHNNELENRSQGYTSEDGA